MHADPGLCKLVDRAAARRRVDRLRGLGCTVVFTNGCFDVLHAGHVHLFREAAALGDVLVVGVNSDDSVRRLKGPGRPVNGLEDRVFVLNELGAVDLVVVFGEDTPAGLVRELRPDVLVKGDDYKLEEVVGREYAGRTVLVPRLPGRSTTETLARTGGTAGA